MTMNSKEMAAVFDAKKDKNKNKVSQTSPDSGGLDNYISYLDDYDRKARGMGSDRGTDRFSGLDVRHVYDAAKDFGVNKYDAADQVLQYARRIEDESKMGGATEDALNKLRDILGNRPSPEPEPEKPYQQSEELSKAKAGVTAYEEEILPNTGDIITGKKPSKQTSKQTTYKDDFLKSYKLNLAKEMEPKNADGSPRDSKIQEEKDKVEGF